ncbi:hypothetical protein Tco_0942829, partial [Tanacetum coccineum]
KTSESAIKTSDYASYESNSSVETPDSMPKPAVNKPKVVSKPKVWSDASIIEEYESDSDDKYAIKPSKEQKNLVVLYWNGLMSKRMGLGYGFTKKACFVCGSFSHLIRDCDFHEKRMAKQVELNKQKGKATGQGENRPVWNNVQRLNHQNKFVPKAVLTKTGILPVNTARQNLSSQAATTSTARKVNTARPIVNEIRPRNNFYKPHSPIRKPFNRTTAPKANFTNHKINTTGDKTVSTIGGNRETAVKASAGYNWRPKRHYWNKVSKYNGGSNSSKNVNFKDPLGRPKHMTWNKAYLVEYQDYNGGPVAIGGSKGQITGKGGYILGSVEGSMKLNELTYLCTKLVDRVTSLEKELKQTKEVHGKALTKLVKKKDSSNREDDKTAYEDISDKIAEVIKILAEAFKERVKTYNRRKRSTDSSNVSNAAGLYKEVQKRQSGSMIRYQTLKKKPVSVAQARKNKMEYLKNMAGYKMNYFKGMSYDHIRPIFEQECNKVQTLFKKDTDVVMTKPKRVAEETLLQESFKKLRTTQASSS